MPSTLDLAWHHDSLVATGPVSSRGLARPPSDKLGRRSGKVMPRGLALCRSAGLWPKSWRLSTSRIIDELVALFVQDE